VRRKLGQHFLTDRQSIDRILATAEITAQDRVVEIGPGAGSLTFSLAGLAGVVVAVEYDAELAQQLQRKFAEHPHVRILHADARHIRYSALFSTESTPLQGGPGLKIVANLPYYAAVPILLAIFRDAPAIQTCTLMFQKEVAERITAAPGTKAYGLLSVTAQYYSTATYCFSLPPQAFRPPPKVMSAVVQLHVTPQPKVHVADEELFFHLVRGAFQSRRKTLKNALAAYRPDLFPSQLLSQAFRELHVAGNIRGERLSLEEFAELSNYCAHFHSQ
jgi:16S rRNA (adenine1518-N6/adenine1519-N6)-dimethyltransferase